MKVIFLNIDHVLNEGGSNKDPTSFLYMNKSNQSIVLNRRFTKYVAILRILTGAKIVLSDPWRFFISRNRYKNKVHKKKAEWNSLDDTFNYYGIIIDDWTPLVNLDMYSTIQDWIDHHPDVTNIVILGCDNPGNVTYLTKYVIDPRNGMKFFDFIKALFILRKRFVNIYKTKHTSFSRTMF